MHRALGNSHRALADLEAAFDEYRRGITIARRSGLKEYEGLLRMSLAGAFSIRGDRTPALQELTKAEALTTGANRARVLFQRAVVIQRFSEGVDALDAYNRVAPLLAEHDDRVFLAHTLSNRGLVQTYLGDQVSAKADLERALALYEELNLPSAGAIPLHNLGLVHTRLMDIPSALASFDAAEARLRELGRPLAGLHVDRAEALLSAGLAEDAFALAQSTARYLERRGLHTDLAEALLIGADAALVLGRPDADDLAARAASAFHSQSRPGWRDRAHILRLEALTVSGSPGPIDERFARRLGQRLAASGLRRSASRAALVEGAIALERGGHRAAAGCLRRGGRARTSGLIEDRLAYWALASSLRLAVGDRSGALAAVRAGLGVLARFRNQIAAPDARVGVAVHARRLVNLGLRAAAQSASPRTLFLWFERTAAVYVPTNSLAATDDETLSMSLDGLRAVVKELGDDGRDDERTTELLRRRQELEALVKKESRRISSSTPSPDGSHGIGAALERATGRKILAFAEIDGDIFRCEVDGPGRFRRRRIGTAPALARQVRSISSLLRRTATRPAAGGDDRTLRSLQRLGDQLVGDLDLQDRDLIIIPRGSLALVPWMALPHLAVSTVTVAPSLGAWAETKAKPAPGSQNTTVLIGPRLPHAAHEANQIASVMDDVSILEPSQATTGAALEALRSSNTVHFICHGRFRSDNPMFSYLELSDGPLMVYDIFGARGPLSNNVVLSACSGAEVSSRPELAFLGMTGAFLATGIGSLVASVSPVRDAESTARLMKTYHRERSRGLPPRQALARGRDEALSPTDRILAGSFLTIGAG